jgi:ABC-type transporter Mla subunit MlaD
MAAVNKFRLGIFVLSGVALLIVCIALLGLRGSFVKKAHLVSYMNDTVQGLNKGAAVKYKGVPVGSVTDLSIQIDDKLVRVDMAVEIRCFTNKKQRNLEKIESFYKFLEKEVQSGLRCTVEYSGITGMRYIEMNYANDTTPHDHPDILDPEVFYLPSASSKITDIVKLVTMSLEKISKVNFDSISEKLEDSLSSMKSLLTDPKLRNSIERLEKLSGNLDQATSEVAKVLTEEKLQGLINNLNEAIGTIDDLGKLSKSVLQNSKVPETTGAIRLASTSVIGLEDNLKLTLQKLNNAIDSITELANSLEEDPGSLLRGKQKQPIFKNQ